MLIMSYLCCETGMEYTVEFAIPARQRLLGKIFQIEEEIPVTFRSRISWCKNSAIVSEGPNSHGVKFIDMPQDSARHIDDWIDNRLKT